MLRRPVALPLDAVSLAVSRFAFIYRAAFEFVCFLRRGTKVLRVGESERSKKRNLNQEREVPRAGFKSDEEKAERGCGWPGLYTLEA